MKILIAHPSLLQQNHLKRTLKDAIGDAEFLTTADLTETYNLTEHQKPDCVLIAEDLSILPEFELLTSLFKIMGISCISLVQSSRPEARHSTFSQIQQLPERASKEDFTLALSKLAAKTKTVLQATQPERCGANYDPGAIILIGASTGGIDALLKVLTHFHSDCPPVLIVQHTGGAFASSLIRLLDGASPAHVLPAQDAVPLAAGHIYLAPDDQCHLTLSPGPKPRASLKVGPAVSGHRPSIDALFTSALHRAAKISAALLTGMGKDGASGLTQLRKAGAHTIGQDQKTSVVYGMPRVAMEMGGVCQQLPIQDIGAALLRSCQIKART
jgi:two-component system chemotaxis response regulator CheB